MKIKPLFLIGMSICFCLQSALDRPLMGQEQKVEEDKALAQEFFDSSVRPQDDLFRAVNGKWLDSFVIPSDRSNYGSFTVLADGAESQIRKIIESAASETHASGTDRQKVGDFYKSFMNTEQVAIVGHQPLDAGLSNIRALKTHHDVFVAFGNFQQLGIGNPVGFYVSVDAKNSTRYLSGLAQSGTTLPDQDYYLNDDEKFAAMRAEYVAYMDRLFELIGREKSEGASQRILELETNLARVQWTRTELRDANKRYNLYAVSDLGSLGENLDWPAFFAAAGVQISEVNVNTPSFFEGLNAILVETPVEVWQDYLEFKLIDAAAPFLTKEFGDAHFKLHDEILAGVPEQRPRWKRGVAVVAGAGDFGALGEMVGKLYVEKYFPPEKKAKIDKLVKNLLEAYRLSIGDLTWMTDATKKRALEKLSKITTKIGYTNQWRDYSRLEVKADDLFGNVQRSASVEYQRMIEQLGQPVNREEWGMTPQTVNAYYNPTKNEIVFPAAILQSPFFNDQADDAVNYGGIGAVIGHEISHAFDDQGSKYDGDGNLNDWWTDEDRFAFGELTKKLIVQFDGYEPLKDNFVNGQLTLGENIADLAGLSISYKAYQLSLGENEAPTIAGWTGSQRFFLGWSQVWRRKYRDAEMIRRLLTDPHSPSWYRANGPVANCDTFYEAFNVQPGDALYRPAEERIRIW